MKKQGIKSFFKPVGTNSNVAKETNPVETTTSVELPGKSSRSTETEIINEKPNQPDSTFVFSKTPFAKQNRSCQTQWVVEYKWLDYNVVNDNVTCFICKKHLQKLDQEKNKKDAFLRTGFHYWKKSLNKFQRSSTVKVSSCCTKIRSYSPSVSPCYCYCKVVRRIKGQQKTYV